MFTSTLAKVGAVFATASAVMLGYTSNAQAEMLFDRGLPTENLNSIFEANRSNVRWATDAQNQGFFGDDFTIGNVGDTFVIDTIRTWMVPGLSIGDPDNLGDWYESFTLLTGLAAEDDISPFASATLDFNSNVTSNPDVTITQVSYPDAAESIYDNFGDFVNIWQVDFNNLNWTIEGGTTYNFGVRGVGREIPDEDIFYPWFNHASNAGLSGSPQDGADNRYLQFDASGNFVYIVDTNGNGWDKSSDINVQIFGEATPKTSVPEPGSVLALLAFITFLTAGSPKKQ
ncbi:MAG: hypothetical protein F6K63_02510 [Moorea sp. SIO1G6]|uniref:PEP-CTERM sorting domain-containing protein n=1 Tax=Moorena producens (strain JHB) TaxID=1454205 RepID=A0A1D9G4D4_MOOP1|nr:MULTISPECIES: hypothetical protein [Moorena]AOY82384.2 hypothetical protein BJP36_23220 [Moorena producens JHB]NES80922.1 hypothetical protein [Moorena sp. SIO2B7]NET63332.1 hypothetical protein [Moorena sp. SIO1G6]